jgi:hypothetical protein
VKTCTGTGFVPGIPPEDNFELKKYQRMSVVIMNESSNWKKIADNKRKYEVLRHQIVNHSILIMISQL